MAREWYATCKDCRKEFGYSDGSYQLSASRGLSRPERCPTCRKLHSREIASLGLSHFELAPIRPIPPDGLKPGDLGGLTRPKRVHAAKDGRPSFDFGKFGIKDIHIREFFDQMREHQVMVIVAPTGSGKSTFFPYRLMVPPEGIAPDLVTRHGQIIVTQPRKQATRNIPAFVAADLHGSSLGAGFDVGFRHSGEPATDWRNKLVYMTDGTLINMIVRNELGRLSLIMIDEAHERSLNIDLILGLLKGQLRRYPHLKLIIASATIDTSLFLRYYGGPEGFNPDQFKTATPDGDSYDNAAIAQYLEGSPVGFYGFPGKRQHPVETRFREDNPIPEAQMPARMPSEVATKVVEILQAMDSGAERTRGDILAFLHGKKPIEQAVAEIKSLLEEDGRLAGKVDVLPLYTELPQQQQDAALKPKKNKSRWRVVVSTNVAETSLTVEGIVHVVDSGLINESQWDPQTQTTYVTPKRHSRAGCIQRWGRAGRIQPGVAHCLYTQEQFDAFPAHTEPEITRAPLEQIVLTAKAAGVNDLRAFDWIQRPSQAELDRAPQFLRQIGALDQDGDLTDHGLELRGFAEETDVANLMILADRFGCAVEMATLIPMRKLGDYTSLLLWDKSWDAPTKRAVHRIHQGLLGPCQDDVEFCLKLWESWEGSTFGRTEDRQREEWAKRFFVRHSVFKHQIAKERAALLDALSAHKKDDRARAIDFDLLTRLRIVITYGLSNQIYQLANRPAAGTTMTDKPIYRPYIRDPEAHPELVQLHEDAVVQISPESVCAGQILDAFVCGKRQRVRKRESPLAEPTTYITAAFLTLIKAEWLRCIGQPHIAVARLIAAETRTSAGSLIPTTTSARLFIDQMYPVGATFECAVGGDSSVRLGPLKANAPRLRAGSSYEDIEAPEEIEALETEGVLSETAGADEKARHVATAPDEDETVIPWMESLDEEDTGPTEELQTARDKIREIFSGRLVRSSGNPPVGAPFHAVVVGYEWSDRQRPVVLLEQPITPAPFERFVERYREGDDITVEVVSIERYVSDGLLYLVVREAETDLEIIMDPYDVSLVGRNFTIEILPIGTQFSATIEEIDRPAHRVRITRLKAAQAAMTSFLASGNERIVDARIVDVRENGLYLWLDPDATKDYLPCSAFVRLDRLPQRPEEMWLGRTCRVRVQPRKWKQPLRRGVAIEDPRVKQKLGPEWDEASNSLNIDKPMAYGRRLNLLDLSGDGAYRRAINILFRRSNELNVRVIDMTGMQNLLPYQGLDHPLRAKVVSITDDAVFVALPDGMEARVPRHEVTYNRRSDLQELITSGQEVDVRVKKVDLDQGQATISMLDPKSDPLRKYTKDQIVVGQVVGFTPDGSGAFVELEPGVEGFLYRDEIGLEDVKDARQLLSDGQQVTARITDLKVDERRLRLTIRALYQSWLSVPSTHRGMVIGRNGSTIQDIMRATGTYINLDSDSGRCSVEGPVQRAVQDAVQRIQTILEKRVISFTIEDRQSGMIIGKDGGTIQRIQQQTGAQIEVNRTQVTVIAPNEATLGRTLDSIRAAISYYEVTMQVPSGRIGRVIGSGGSNIRSVRQQTDTWIDIAKDSSGRIRIEGKTRGNTERAAQLIQGYAASTVSFTGREGPIPSQLVPRRQLTIAKADLERLIRKQGGFFAMILGRRKSAIDRIQASTGTHISTDSSTSTVMISGSSFDSVERAAQEIDAALKEQSGT